MNISVRLFARAKELAGTDHCQLELPVDACVADLRAQMLSQFPALEPIAARLLVAVNSEYAQDHDSLNDHCEVAMFPPVSGG